MASTADTKNLGANTSLKKYGKKPDFHIGLYPALYRHNGNHYSQVYMHSSSSFHAIKHERTFAKQGRHTLGKKSTLV